MAFIKFSHEEFAPLDPKYFPYPGIPPPLVRKTWISKVESYIEENLHLAAIAEELKNNGKVVRKRGRPKKTIKDTVSCENKEEEKTTTHDDLDWIANVLESSDEDRGREETAESQGIESQKNGTLKLLPNSRKIKKQTATPTCQECNKTFKTSRTFKYHLKLHSGKLLECNDCGRGFVTKYLLKCHQRIHTGALFTCEEAGCGRGFTTAELLKVHRRRHNGEKPFACDKCNKSFYVVSNLIQHKGTHEEEKKYLCNECGACFNQKRCLHVHMAIHKDKTIICAVCGKQWARKSDLEQHMSVHTQEKKYQCQLCNIKFSQISSLNRHVVKYCSKI